MQHYSIRRGTAPWATGSTEVIEAALTAISDMLFVCFLLSVVWLSSLRGIHSCGGRHGLGFRLGLLGLFVFMFLLFRLRLKAKTIKQKPKASPAGLLGRRCLTCVRACAYTHVLVPFSCAQSSGTSQLPDNGLPCVHDHLSSRFRSLGSLAWLLALIEPSLLKC